MNRYPLPGYLQHHTQPGGNKNEIRKAIEKTEQYKTTHIHTKNETSDPI